MDVDDLVAAILALSDAQYLELAARLERVGRPVRDHFEHVVDTLLCKIEYVAQEARNRFIPKPRKGDRDALIARYRDRDGLTFGEIAKRLHLKPGTAKAAYHRFKKRLTTDT